MAIFHHDLKRGLKGTATEHARYIGRVGKFSDREDLVHEVVQNLPDWADGAHTFWKAADAYERANGAVYREHVIALPNELTREQNCELAEQLADALLGKKTYQLAVHEPAGSLSGTANPHMHLMYSDRVDDGIARSPKQTFSRYNPKHPDRGGCRKDSGGLPPGLLKDQVINARKMIADVQNAALAHHGFDVTVDHRSLLDQGQDRAPERHLGPVRIKRMSSQEKSNYASLRALRAGTTGVA